MIKNRWFSLAALHVFTSLAWGSDSGLRLHLDASKGVDFSEGKVSSWQDLSGNLFKAQVPEGADCPAYRQEPTDLNRHPCLSFAGRQALKMDGWVLPKECRSFTVLAVALTEGQEGVGLFSVRQGAVPLIQLDTDRNGAARFIVRDTKQRTLQSLDRPYSGRWGVYVGVLDSIDEQNGRIQVFFGGREGNPEKGPFSSPVSGDVQWIGALPLGEKTLSWNGCIAEIMVYDRALSSKERENLVRMLSEKYGLPYRLEDEALKVQVYPWNTDPRPAQEELEADVCIVGAGSAGIGAALAAGRRGVRVLLVERQEKLGGTGVNGLVCSWEPGPGCSLAREIFDRMRLLPRATGVAQHDPNQSTGFPMGQWYITDGLLYEDSLQRAGVPRQEMRCIPYDPDVFHRVVEEMLLVTGKVSILKETTFFHAERNMEGSRVTSILVEGPDGSVSRIHAKVFIDCTGCIHLLRDLDCKVMLGHDPKSRFQEPSAPDEPSLELNAISRCYQVRPSSNPRREPPVDSPIPHFAKAAHVTGWKDGVRVINPLPTLPGRALIDQGYENCMKITDKAVRAHWRWLQETEDFEGYEFDKIAPMLGIRESYRAVTRYVLTEQDLIAGLSGQTHEDIIAVADHPCDIHGSGGRLAAVKEPYGVPYRCLIPEGNWENLLVACRGAGFSKIAASSCRLERTMIQLGHAAGAAAAMAVKKDVPVDAIDVPRLVQELNARGRVSP